MVKFPYMLPHNWLFFVSRRFARVDRRSRSLATSFLSTLGICFGVMTLIVTLSVMNGFQRLSIDAIMEISSYHVRFTESYGGEVSSLGSALRSLPHPSLSRFTHPEVLAAVPFLEAQTLMVGPGKAGGASSERQQAALVRAVPPDICTIDAGFARQAEIRRGSFDLTAPDSIVLGSELAHTLGVSLGDTVNLLALSGGADVDLISANRTFTVTGVFLSTYADINVGYCFISLDDGVKYFGKDAKLIWGLKLKNADHAYRVIAALEQGLDPAAGTWESWQSYNRAFFGALRVEKNMLMLFVFIIFVVVGVNIYNGMRRMVFERQGEIAVFAALGGRKRDIQGVFILRGGLNGFLGTFIGVLLGILLCVDMDKVFRLVSSLSYYFQYFFTALFNEEALWYLRENPMYQVYAGIPARMYPGEIVFTAFFGIFSALAAAWAASRNAVTANISEVLHEE